MFEQLGASVEEACPDLDGADEVFGTLRAWLFDAAFGEIARRHPDKVKESIRWNAEMGAKLTGPDLAAAEQLHTKLYERMVDVLRAATTSCWRRRPRCCPSRSRSSTRPRSPACTQDNYLEWMRSCTVISATGCPALSVPGGFTADGLPVGLQIIGAPRADRRVLEVGPRLRAGHPLRRAPSRPLTVLRSLATGLASPRSRRAHTVAVSIDDGENVPQLLRGAGKAAGLAALAQAAQRADGDQQLRELLPVARGDVGELRRRPRLRAVPRLDPGRDQLRAACRRPAVRSAEHVRGQRGLLGGQVVAQRGAGHRRPAAVPRQRDHQFAQRHQPQPLGQALHHLPGQRDRRPGPLGDHREVECGREQRRGGDLGGQRGGHTGVLQPAARSA